MILFALRTTTVVCTKYAKRAKKQKEKKSPLNKYLLLRVILTIAFQYFVNFSFVSLEQWDVAVEPGLQEMTHIRQPLFRSL